ncbi:hypothetical protein [Kribbella endophytica]
MRDYLMTKAPWWLLVLVNGGLFFVITLIFRALAPSFAPDSILGAVISSVFFGVFIATLTAGSRPRRGSGPTDQD